MKGCSPGIPDRIRGNGYDPGNGSGCGRMPGNQGKGRIMEEQVSIVVPVYNVGQYLRACLDSLVAQTYRNLEIILVDDGATDGSGEICEEYARKDGRIRVIHKENGGLSDARNRGIRSAGGSWLVFVDGDDTVSRDYVEYLYGLVAARGADIGICRLIHCFREGRAEFEPESEQRVLDAEEAVCEMLYQKSFLVAACGKIFRRELFRETLFPRGMLFEDSAVMYKILDGAEKIVYGDAGLYGYMHRENSITTRKFSKKDCDILPICDRIAEYFAGRGGNLRKAAASYQVVGALRVYLNAPRNGMYDSEIRKCIRIIKEKGWKVMRDSRARTKTRLALLLFFTARPLMHILYRRIDRWK